MDYKNGKIYKIVSDNTDKIYIGSTCSMLSKRLHGHKNSYTQFLKGNKTNTSSSELIKLGNVDIILIENYSCESKEQLHARERYHIEQNKCICVNKLLPIRNSKEYYQDNKEKIAEYKKEYTELNIEKIKERNKEYYQENKEIIAEKQRLYLKEIKCVCGSNFVRNGRIRHEKTLKHIKYIESNQL